MPGPWWRWIGRLLGYALLAVVASPALLFMLLLVTLLVGLGLALLGFFMIPAVVVSELLHDWVGLPFWFWMIPTGLGAVLFWVFFLAWLWDSATTVYETSAARTSCSPWPWLLAGLLLGHWWWGGDGG